MVLLSILLSIQKGTAGDERQMDEGPRRSGHVAF